MSDHVDILADFRAALDGLTDTMRVTDPRGHTGEVGSVVAQVQDGRPPVSDDSFFSGGFRGTPPMWLSGLDWLQDVENTVRDLARSANLDAPFYAELLALLDWAKIAPWPPSVGDELARAADHLVTVRAAGLRLIYPELFTVSAPCPDCQAQHVNAPCPDGGTTSRPALVVRELWSECSACGAEWWGADIVTKLAAGIDAAEVAADALAVEPLAA